jgi:hypothetical protein
LRDFDPAATRAFDVIRNGRGYAKREMNKPARCQYRSWLSCSGRQGELQARLLGASRDDRAATADEPARPRSYDAGRRLAAKLLTKDEARRIAAAIALGKSTVWISLYSHGEYWHCARVGEEGTGFAVSKGGEESGAAASEGRACTVTVPNVQQWLVPTQTRCRLGNLARASLSVMQAGEL